MGTIVAVHNFGAGYIIEIAPLSGPTIMLPFSNAVVPDVDLKGGRIVIAPPDEIDARISSAKTRFALCPRMTTVKKR
jgi:16S rRNA processing protein RimM